MTLPSPQVFEHQDKITVELPRTPLELNLKAFFPVESTDPTNCFIPNNVNFIVDTCIIKKLGINLTISAITQGYTTETLSISFKRFKNPYSTFPLKIFDVTVVKAPELGHGVDWEDSDYQRERVREKAYENKTLTLSGMTPDAIQAVSITPLNLIVAAKFVSVRFSVRVKTEIRRVSMLSFFIPLWNPDEGVNGKHHILAGTPYCLGIQGLGPMFSCAYEASKQTLYIYRPVEETVPGGTVFTFEMDNFWNPYSGRPKHGFHCYTLDENFGVVDSSEVAGLDITFTVTDWTYLPSVKIIRPDITTAQREVGEVDISTTIRYQSAGKIEIFMDMPADADCRIEVRFPLDMPLTVDLKKVSSTGMLESPRVDPTHIDLSTRSFYLDGCSSYQSQIHNTLWMYNMRNKDSVRQTLSFAVYLWSVDKLTGLVHKVAKKEDNIFLMETDFSVGSVVSLFVTAVDTYVIRQHTKYAVQFKTVDPIPNNSKIKVRFPTTIDLVKGPCKLETVSFPFNLNAACEVTKNTVVITNPFVGLEIYDPLNGTGTSISFSFTTGGKNPVVACDAGPFLVSTFAIFDGVDHAIDYYHFHAKDDKMPRFAAFIPISDSLKVVMMRPSNEMTYNAPTTYTLKIFPRLLTPQYSKLQIAFPPEIQLQEGLTQVICRAYLETGMVISYSVPEALSPLTFTMSTIFTAGPYTAVGEPFNLECDGLQNPKTLNATSSFALATFDQNGCGIERVNSGIFIKMFGLPSFQNVSVYSEVPYNGQISSLVLEFQAYISFSNNYTIQLKFPPDVQVPDFPECLPHTLVAKATCKKMSENRLSAYLVFSNPPVLRYIRFGFKVDKIKNPISTKPTLRFSEIIAYDKLMDQVAYYTDPGPILTNPLPAKANGTLDQSDKNVGVEATYTITYRTVNEMPVGAGFIIDYPDTVQTLATGMTISLVYYKNVAYPQGWYVDQSNRTIQIRRGLPLAIPAGSELKIVFGPIINPVHQNMPNTSFNITSYTDTTYRFSIDQVDHDLIPTYTCRFPCRRCPSRQQPDTCLKCYTDINDPLRNVNVGYLNGTKCLEKCPAGTTANDQFVCLGVKTSVLEITSFEANYQPVWYSFKIHPTGAGGIMKFWNSSVLEVTFPSQIKMATGENNVWCATHVYIPPWQKYMNAGYTKVTNLKPITVEISNIFNSELDYKPGTIITLKCGQLRNPRTLDLTGNIVVINKTSPEVFWAFPVQMKKYPSFQDFDVKILNPTTGASTEYNFTFISGNEMLSSQYIVIDLTTDVTLLEDDPSTLTINEGILCVADQLHLAEVQCIIDKICITSSSDPNEPQVYLPTGKLYVKITLTETTKPLPSGSFFSFKLQNVRNPPFTKPIQIKSVDLLDTDKILIQKYSVKPFPFLVMKDAAEIVTKSISYEIQTVDMISSVTIDFRNVNRMPSNGFIVVNYPLSAQFVLNQPLASTVYVDGLWRGSVIQVDYIRRNIIIEMQAPPNPLMKEIPRGGQILIKLKPFNNTALNNEEFKIKTFTDRTLRYAIDQITSGLVLFSCEAGYFLQGGNTCVKCQPPCKTCLTSTLCLSCYSENDEFLPTQGLGKSYFYNGNCFQKLNQCAASAI